MPTWQATAVVPFQWHMQAAGGIMPTDGSLPERLEPVSRIPRQSASFGDISIRMRPLGETELPPQPGFEYAAIRQQVDAESAQAALERIHPALELLLDDLAFQLQTTFIVLQLEILDVTEPLAIGDEREMLLYPFPQGYQQWKFARSTAMGTETVAIVPTLRSDYAALPNRHQQALDWYLKGIHAPVDSDRYIYFWVALEVLEKLTPHTVATPYNANCGHTIDRCPHCDKPTARRVNGQSLQRLLQAVGVSPADAKQMWKMRMMVHGARTFSSPESTDLGRLLQILRAAVVALLKPALGMDAAAPPIVGYGGPAVGAFALGGRREVGPDDAS